MPTVGGRAGGLRGHALPGLLKGPSVASFGVMLPVACFLEGF